MATEYLPRNNITLFFSHPQIRLICSKAPGSEADVQGPARGTGSDGDHTTAPTLPGDTARPAVLAAERLLFPA